jgi:hypothetical protein
VDAAAPETARARAGTAAGICVVLLATAWVLIGTKPEQSYGDTLFSRLATVYSLTEYGRWAINDPAMPEMSNPFEPRTIDKVEVDGRILSSKPPLLPILMMSELLALQPVAGWLLENPDDPKAAAWVMSVTWSGVPFVLLTLFVWLIARRAMPGRVAAPAFVALAVAGTQAAAYATVFNNHVIAAACVVACFWLAPRLYERPAKAEFVLFGLCAGLGAATDIPTAVFPACLGLWLARTRLKQLILFAVPAAALPLAIQTMALIAATGSPLPVQMHGDWYLYESSYWRNPGGVDALADPKGAYLFHITLGRVGLFSLFPVTLFGIAGMWYAWRAGDARVRGIAIAGALASAILFAYYAMTTNNYGGEAWGFRWSIVIAPVMLILAVPAVARMRRPWQWATAAVLLAVSVYSVAECVRHPWQANTEWTTRVFGKSL